MSREIIALHNTVQDSMRALFAALDKDGKASNPEFLTVFDGLARAEEKLASLINDRGRMPVGLEFNIKDKLKETVDTYKLYRRDSRSEEKSADDRQWSWENAENKMEDAKWLKALLIYWARIPDQDQAAEESSERIPLTAADLTEIRDRLGVDEPFQNVVSENSVPLNAVMQKRLAISGCESPAVSATI